MSVKYLRCGGMTDTTVRVKAKTTSGSTARLAVADNAGMSGPVFYGPVSPSQSMVTFDATGLTADTKYWYQVEDNGVLDTSKTGQFRTFGVPGEPYNLLIAAFSCAGASPVFPGQSGALVSTRISNHPGFLDVAATGAQLLIQDGDLSYYNLGAGQFGIVGGQSLANTRRAYDDPLEYSPNQAALFRSMAVMHQADDHDFGKNDDDGSNPTKDNWAQVWRERTPDYPTASPNTPGDAGTYRSFQAGRLFVVVTDGRYYRDPPDAPAPRTYLGAGQLAWLDSTLAAAAAADGVKALCWVSTQPSSSGGTTSWGGYSEEKNQVYEMFGDHGFTSRMFQIAGDQHQLGFDTGASNGRGFPIYVMSPMDSSSGGASGNYDLGSFVDNSNRGQYGLVNFQDPGGTSLSWTAKGFSYSA